MTPLKQQISLIPFSIEHWCPYKRRRFENWWDQTFCILLIKHVLLVNFHSVTRPIAYYYYYYFLIFFLLLLLLPPSIRRILCDRSLSFFHSLSFCKQDNWRTRKRTSTKLGMGKRWPSRSGWLLVVIRICTWIPVFHFLHHCGIGDFPTFVSISLFSQFSHTINSRFEPNLAKRMMPTSVSTIWERIFDGHPNPD